MFIRIKTSKNSPKKSVQIVESYRNKDGKARQRIVRHMGTALTDKELEAIKNFAEYVKADLESQKTPALFKPQQLAEMAIKARRQSCKDEDLNVNLKNISEKNRVTIGVHEAFGKIYNQLGFDDLLSARKKASAKNLRNIVMARIANPNSKRGSVADLANDFGISISLDSVYRMMDAIDDFIIDKARQMAYQSTKTLLGDDINLLFYDCTTLYFESFTEDELKKNGYSKDMKFNQPQVVLGLLATSEGLPVGYEVFPGNQFEGATLEVIIPDIVKKYNLKRVIFTADSAMLNKKNLDYLEESGLEYIVAARLRNLTDKWKQTITKTSSYLTIANSNGYEKLRSFDYGKGRKLIVTYSQKLARKNKYDRDKAIEKLRKKLEKNSQPASLISNYGYKKFLKVTGEVKVLLDEDKYVKAAEFDGLHGVITNVKDLSDSQVISYYHSLWQIEECFRISKHDLKIRPIYHWTPKRIRAHIMICFLALVCVRHLSYRVKLRFEAMSIARMTNALNHIQLSILDDKKTNCRYALPSRFNEDASKIYKTLDLAINTTPYKLV
jgi:transposase